MTLFIVFSWSDQFVSVAITTKELSNTSGFRMYRGDKATRISDDESAVTHMSIPVKTSTRSIGRTDAK